jgi:hypothetical protein
MATCSQFVGETRHKTEKKRGIKTVEILSVCELRFFDITTLEQWVIGIRIFDKKMTFLKM